ncbi:hypothetical protein PG994_003300 [Apiospora phragmitis]|uniref:MFS transporter n=1 Tax=Apiospora phragmitis TaxID=2905665 RepID=A0ABR1VXR5_9PEZI
MAGIIAYFRQLFYPAGISHQIIQYPYKGSGTSSSPYILAFIDHDPSDPQQLPRWKKLVCTILVAFATLAVTFISSAYLGAVPGIMADFEISDDLAVLGVSVFVLGFALGPLLWAPLSALWTTTLFFYTYLVVTAFNVGCAVANSFATLVVLRFFAGTFGSSTLTNSGAIIADMYSANERGPIVGGYLGEAAGWRWVYGLFAIFTGVVLLLVTAVVPETYAPLLLAKRAEELSKVTGKSFAAQTHINKTQTTLGQQFKNIHDVSSLARRLRDSTWMVPQTSQLSFLGAAVGMPIGVLHGIYVNKEYVRLAAQHDGFLPPEVRLRVGIFASMALPAGLFLFVWTKGPEIHWIVPILGTAIFSYGLVVLFLSLTNYLVDTYVIFAASTVLRSLFGAGFPLFTTPMLRALGFHWAGSVPAFLAAACVPVPLVFYLYGVRIRRKGKYAAQAAEMLKKLRDNANTATAPATTPATTTNTGNNDSGALVAKHASRNTSGAELLAPSTVGSEMEMSRMSSRGEGAEP